MDNKSNICPKCGRSYVLSSSLKTHMLSHNQENVYTCPFCDESFLQEYLLKQHMINHRDDGKDTETSVKLLSDKSDFGIDYLKGRNCKIEKLRVYKRRFKCSKCKAIFHSKEELDKHKLSKSDKDLKNHKQNDFVGETGILYTIEDTHTGSSSNNNHSFVICPVCRVAFLDQSTLAAHLAVHACDTEALNVHTLTAEISPLVTSTQEDLMQNGEVRSITDSDNSCDDQNSNNDMFSCPKCMIIFLREVDLKEHNLSHSLSVVAPSTVESPVIRISSMPLNTNLPSQEIAECPFVNGDQNQSFTALYKCLACPVVIFLREEVERHVATHKSFADPTYKDDNSNSQEGRNCLSKKQDQPAFDTFYKCIICPLIFLERSEAEMHASTHQDALGIGIKLESQDNTLAVSGISDIPTVCSANSAHESMITIFQSYECPGCARFFSDVSELECHTLRCYKGFRPSLPLVTEICCTDLFGQSIVVSSFNVKDSSQIVKENVTSSILANGKVIHTSTEIPKTDKDLGRKNHKCLVCDKEFTSVKKLNDHKRIHGEKKHICEVCGKKFRANSYLKAHMSVHFEIKPYKCPECNKSFKSSTALKTHKDVHSDSRPFKCLMCNASFKQKVALKVHGLVHSTTSPFTCDTCGKKFKSSYALKGHSKIHDVKTSNKNKIYYCSDCGKTYNSLKYYQLHKKVHDGSAPHKCQHCGKSFTLKALLTQHLRIHSGERPFKCIKCGKMFSHRSTLKNHMDSHLSMKRYVCHICGIHIAHKQSLSIHLKRHSGVKPHECNVCSKRFFMKNNFKRHLRSHTGERPYQCLECGKKFKQSTHLKNHMSYHKGEKCFECNTCHKRFANKSSLRNHVAAHTSKKPHECPKCEKTFRNRSSLKIHHLSHDAEEKFVCPECGKRFKRDASLQVHLKRKADSFTFSCQVCKRVFTRRTCLYQHKKLHTVLNKGIDDRMNLGNELEELETMNVSEIESIKVSEVLEEFGNSEGIQVHIIV